MRADQAAADGLGIIGLDTPVIDFVSQTTPFVQTNVGDATAFNVGVPTDFIIGDMVFAFISVKANAVLTPTIAPAVPAAGWASVIQRSHNTQYVWSVQYKGITGLAEPANWDQFLQSGAGAATVHAVLVVYRNMDTTATARSQIDVNRAGNITPLLTGDLTTLARPGDLLWVTVNSKNGTGGIAPPTGYTELMDQVTGGLWSYAAYKIALGPADASEQHASMAITAGAAADLNGAFIEAVRHYGGA